MLQSLERKKLALELTEKKKKKKVYTEYKTVKLKALG